MINETGGEIINHVSALIAGMGRPPLNIIKLHVSLNPADIDRIDAVTGTYGRSKFIRDAIRQALDQIAPAEDAKGPPFIEYDGHRKTRLTPSGRALLFDAIRKRGFDQVMAQLGHTDPIEFMPPLRGHRTVTGGATSVLIAEIIGKSKD